MHSHVWGLGFRVPVRCMCACYMCMLRPGSYCVGTHLKAPAYTFSVLKRLGLKQVGLLVFLIQGHKYKYQYSSWYSVAFNIISILYYPVYQFILSVSVRTFHAQLYIRKPLHYTPKP